MVKRENGRKNASQKYKRKNGKWYHFQAYSKEELRRRSPLGYVFISRTLVSLLVLMSTVAVVNFSQRDDLPLWRKAAFCLGLVTITSYTTSRVWPVKKGVYLEVTDSEELANLEEQEDVNI